MPTSSDDAARVWRERCRAALTAAAAAGGVFWELAGDRALQDVEAAARRRREGEAPHILDGVPVAVKDAFAVRGLPQHLGLRQLTVSERDAAAVAALRAAGAIVIGTTAMDQLAWTMSGQAPGYPRYDNPRSRGRSPGGSSGGAAAAVSAGIVPLALAADSAGSIRVPAAWCDVVGFKPSFGAIDLHGCAPLAPALDTAGLIAQHVDDCRRAMAALWAAPPHSPARPPAPRVGVPAPLIAGTDCDARVLAAFDHALERLRSAGWAVCDIDGPPPVRGLGAVFAANLAARWGDLLNAQPDDLVDPDVCAGLNYGRSLTVDDYLHACDALAEARYRARSLFAQAEVLALPTAPILPPALETPAPVSIASAFTRPWSAFGWPAVSVPCPASDAAGCGIQLVASAGDDLRLLSWASDLQEMISRG